MDCVSPKVIWPHRSVDWCDRNEEYPVSVPCGKCLPCLVRKRLQWCFRLEQEYKYSSSAWFVTLTYDERHLRTDRSLNKRDVQLYLKRLRKADGTNRVRYYAVGEYGTRSGRPHYHLLLFNVRYSSNNALIKDAWKDSKGSFIGNVHIGRVTEASISYCTKYVIQMQDDYGDLQRPFSLMSRAYGIGGMYLQDEIIKWHRDNKALFAFRYEDKVILPRFYRDRIWYKDHPDREIVSKEAMVLSLQKREHERKFFERRYGARGPEKFIELRDAVISRIRSKVAYTQKF